VLPVRVESSIHSIDTDVDSAIKLRHRLRMSITINVKYLHKMFHRAQWNTGLVGMGHIGQHWFHTNQ